MAYDYITQFDSPNYTPASQTTSVWGVQRQIKHIDIHWWGDPSTNPTFEGTVNYLCRANGNTSANFIATGTGRRVACIVSPADNSWATVQDNPYSISIECDPRCRDEDYDVVAELIADIRSAYGDNLTLHPHNEFYATTCPGNWDLARLDALSRTKVSHAQWGDVTNKVTTPPAPKPANATEAEIKQAYLDILERPADAAGIAHYENYPLDFVKADLLKSTEYSTLQNNKAAAQAAAVAKAKAEADAKAAQDQQIADEQAASEKARADAQAAAQATTDVAVQSGIRKFFQELFTLIVNFFKGEK